MRMTLFRSPLVAGVVLAIGLSCGDPASPPPPPEGVQTVTLTPVRDTLVSLNETVQLTAVGRDFANVVIPAASFSWSSSDAAIASVSDAGVVTALKNGSATITATANGNSATTAIVVRQRAATMDVLTGDIQAASVGAPLDTMLTFLLKDAGGSPAEGIALVFAGVGSAGVATPGQVTTTATGEATTQWTLGTVPGVQQLLVTVTDHAALFDTLDATAFAAEPDTMFAAGGAGQAELPSLALPAPLQVKVVDKYDNPIADVPIVFSVTGGGGSLDSTEVLTDLDGIATVRWTLGAALGAQTVQAILPDSAVGPIVDLPGSPVTFTATAVDFTVTGVAATPAVGAEMIVIGSGFDPVAENNAVTVGGVAATVTGVSDAQSKLHVLVPSFGCTPAQSRAISVTRGITTQQVNATVHPADPLALAVGQHTVVSDPASFCLQFLPADGGEYIVGVTSTRALNGELPFRMIADAGGIPPQSSLRTSALRASSVRASASPPAASTPSTDGRDRSLRNWEASFFRSTTFRATRSALRAAPTRRVSAVGDIIPIRIPDITTDPCNTFTTVNARVIAMGPRLTVATDATLPADPASVLAVSTALQGFLNTFGTAIYDMATTHFGLPADLDGNERVTVVFSPSVSGLPVFTSAMDHVAPSVCPASNNGEVVYANVTATPSSTDLDALLAGSLPALTHELAHMIQLSKRIGVGGFPLPFWLAEGQAMLATELAGRTVRGDTPRMDFGAAVVNADANAVTWYDPLFDNLSNLFGFTGGASVGAEGMARCSVFGFAGVTTPCTGNFARGAAWSFLRFMSDRMATAYATGEAGFLRDLLATRPDSDAVGVLESLVDAKVDELLVQWAMALAVDGRVSAASAPLLQMPSWDLANIFDARPSAERLTPMPLAFADFIQDARVVGGGTFYTRITNGAAHDAVALQVSDELGNALVEDLRPRLWIVRIN
ncbi:MAG TPA: Ig-like domain-containing protein [Gemmatimonadaceae bacterium]|nr:Ig-like domain-containing protein [Gemmatimonadaceae bacterium]